MFVCCECCVLSGRGILRWADHSSREVLPTLVRRWVRSRNLVNEEAMAHGTVAPITKRGVKTQRNKRAAVICRVFYCLQLDSLPMCHNNPNEQQKPSESTMWESAEEFKRR